MTNWKREFGLNTCEKSILVGLLLSIIFSFVNFSARCNIISDKVLRLHVIANSDSELDQSLKFRVRDRIIGFFKQQDLKTLEETKEFARDHIDDLVALSQDEVIKGGCFYRVTAEICRASFNTRVYGDLSLPAGQYDSLRVTIGEGAGRNWWCVIFPPMCIPAAEDCALDRNNYEVNFSDNDRRLIENKTKYKIKFKIVEIFESWHNRISRLRKKIITWLRKRN